jgi:ubiquinone/menaquinone biosynthesis C-methylase UbiE
MDHTRKQLGILSDIDAVASLIGLKGLTVIDVGCGPGNNARELSAHGASVMAIEPDPIQADKNRVAPPIPGVTFVEARAEELPIPEKSVDGVFFFRSLHHVPVARMDAAIEKAASALKPGGFLFVAEPAMTGTHFAVMRPFHDETRVRTEAQAALARTATKLFRDEEAYVYEQRLRYDNFEAMVSRVTGQTFNKIRRSDVETEQVRSLFEAGRLATGGYEFVQPMLVNVYRNAR